MAEVAQKVCRLSSLRYSQGRPVRHVEGSGTRYANVTLTNSRYEDASKRKFSHFQPKRLLAELEIELSRVKKGHSVDEICIFNTYSDWNSSRVVGFVQARQIFQGFSAFRIRGATSGHLNRTSWIRGAISGHLNRTSWIRGAISGHLNSIRSAQPHRTFCSVIFIRVKQESERPQWCSSPSRSYSKTSDSSRYRNRTAYYDILKVSPNATQAQIKTAYYKQCLVHHPDKNPGDQESVQRFSDISEAYSVLGDPALKRKYDLGFRSTSDVQGPGPPASTDTPKSKAYYQTGAKPMFDFDAFYQAHYGEQLQKQREMQERKKRMEELLKKRDKQRQRRSAVEMVMLMLIFTVGVLVSNLK